MAKSSKNMYKYNSMLNVGKETVKAISDLKYSMGFRTNDEVLRYLIDHCQQSLNGDIEWRNGSDSHTFYCYFDNYKHSMLEMIRIVKAKFPSSVISFEESMEGDEMIIMIQTY